MQIENKNSPIIVVTIMIKNEENTIINTLSSFLTQGIDHFFILDTGSKDNTVKIVQEFLQNENVTGYLAEEKFIDFATSRNKTLELTEKKFPNATFFLMPDAEWHLRNASALIEFCEQEKDSSIPLYLVNINMNDSQFYSARLFRNKAKIRFSGVVHEAPTIVTENKCPESVFFEIINTHHGIEKSRKRWQKDLLLLSNSYNKNTNDPRNTFYLAQTYECLGLLESAYKYYTHRSKLHGWSEENYITYYRLGEIAEKLKNISWESAMSHYLQAFAMRPHRIEPLVKIANHYWPNNIHTCYIFIKHAYDIPYPKNDTLFIEKKMYLYDRYEIMSRCAWYLEEYKLGEQATLKALEVHPEMEHLHRNLQLYKNKLNINEKQNY